MNRYDAHPGDIGMVTSQSLIGQFIKVGQFILGDHSHITHVFVVLNDGQIIEAMPGGARFATLDKYPDAIYSRFRLTRTQRDMIVEEAIRMEGTPYSFLDFLSLFLTHLTRVRWLNLKLRWIPGFVRNRVSSSGHMICSQLCVEAYQRSGIELFPEDTLPMDVTPGDIARRVLEYRGETF